MFSLSILDRKDLKGFLKRIPAKIKKDVAEDCYDISKELRNNVINAMQRTPRDTTHAYKSTKSGKVHHPSAPGFPPAVDTGNYVTHILSRRIPGGGETYVYGAPYWEYLEPTPFGSGSRRMRARPVWQNQIDDLNVADRIMKSINKRMK